MRSRIKFSAFFLLVFIFLIAMALGNRIYADDDNYILKKSVMDMGGGRSNSENFRFIDAIGQPATIGNASSEDYYGSFGFFSQREYKPSGAPLIYPVASSQQTIGEQFWVEINVGSSSHPIANLFVLRFHLMFTHTEFIDVVSPYSENIVLGELFGDSGHLDATVIENEGKIAISIVGSTQQLVSGYGTAVKVKFLSHPDTPNGTTVTFAIANVQAIDPQRNEIAVENGSLSVTLMEQTQISEKNSSALPAHYQLYQNYPNPFNPTTTIRFDLPQAAHVKLLIYNVNGKLVRQLVNAQQPAGAHSLIWDGRDETGKIVSSGMYFFHLEARGTGAEKKSFMATKKLILMK